VVAEKLEQRERRGWWVVGLSLFHGVLVFVLVLGVVVVVVYGHGVVLIVLAGALLLRLLVIGVHGFDGPTVVLVVLIVVLIVVVLIVIVLIVILVLVLVLVAAFVLGVTARKSLEVLEDFALGGAIGRCDFSPFHLFLRLGHNRGHSWVRRRGRDERFHLIDGFLSQTLGGGTTGFGR
jgi:hypothetical protein